MGSLRDLPIRRKLIAMAVATTACALVLISAIFLLTTFFVVRRAVHDDLVTQAAIVAENTTAALTFGDRQAALETLLALHAKASIDVACVYDRDGAVFAESRLAAGA